MWATKHAANICLGVSHNPWAIGMKKRATASGKKEPPHPAQYRNSQQSQRLIATGPDMPDAMLRPWAVLSEHV